jgi:GTP-binding protein HflX
MIELNNNTQEKALLIALNIGNLRGELVDEHLDELEELANTAGAVTVAKIIQEKSAVDPAFYIGKGKAEEAAAFVENEDINLVIFDDDLSPVQARNLERLINRKILDRSGLILDIFASRAKTKEAKTQVELAQLQYLLPRLTRAWTHLSKQYGGIGTKGPGETQIETDRRIVRNRISKLKEKLEKIEIQRETQSKGREETIRIAIVGYTNAGKSTLFNLITNAGVFAEDKLFATLDSTTRAFSLGKHEKLLMSDTVGFIRKLPPNLVASFKSTLNEVRNADIILHVIDLSNAYFEDHIQVVEETLRELNSYGKTQIKIFNKIDLVRDKSKIGYIRNKYEDAVIISAAKGMNVIKLKDAITEVINRVYTEEKVDLDLSDSKTAAKIFSLADVISTDYDDNSIHIRYKTNKENSNKIKKLVNGK